MQNNISADVITNIDIQKKGSSQKVVDKTQRFIQVIGIAFTGIISILCILPFILIISASFTEERSITLYGFSLIPRAFSLNAYRLIFQHPKQILGSYGVTIGMTAIGTITGLFIISMTGYALQRPDFPLRNIISFYIYFTTLFSGGLIPFYMLITQTLKLKDNYLAVLLPYL